MKKTITISKSDFQMEQIPDESPDLSWIGEYSDQLKDGAIDREEIGDKRRNEYRYFIPTLNGEQTGNPDSPQQDYQRMESYNRGDWGVIGIRASVEFQIPSKQGGYWINQTIHSPGLWGIESDSGQDYFREVFAEEANILAEMLEALGIQITN